MEQEWTTPNRSSEIGCFIRNQSCTLNGSNKTCFLNNGRNSASTVVLEQIEFLQSEIQEKDNKIALLESKYNEAFKDAVRYKTEATTAKSYVYSLPTKDEMAKLSRDLSTCMEEKKQLNRDLNSEKAKTSRMNTDINTLKQKITDLTGTLKMQSSEMEALHYQISCWERRRKAAALAGEVTIEDVLADKSDLEVEFKQLKIKSARREKNLLTALLKLKNEMDKLKEGLNESLEREGTLKTQLSQLEDELIASKQQIINLQSTNNGLNEDICALSHQLRDLRSKDEDREKNNVDTLRLTIDMDRSRVSLERMMEFIQNVLQGQFLDPALLFSACEGDDSGTIYEGGTIPTCELKELVQRRCREADLMKKKLENCQQHLMKLYADNLSSSITNQCNIQ